MHSLANHDCLLQRRLRKRGCTPVWLLHHSLRKGQSLRSTSDISGGVCGPVEHDGDRAEKAKTKEFKKATRENEMQASGPATKERLKQKESKEKREKNRRRSSARTRDQQHMTRPLYMTETHRHCRLRRGVSMKQHQMTPPLMHCSNHFNNQLRLGLSPEIDGINPARWKS